MSVFTDCKCQPLCIHCSIDNVIFNDFIILNNIINYDINVLTYTVQHQIPISILSIHVDLLLRLRY